MVFLQIKIKIKIKIKIRILINKIVKEDGFL
jgi:hypothetical protein